MLPAVKTENVFTAASIFLIFIWVMGSASVNECKLPKTEFIYHMRMTAEIWIRNMLPAVKTENVFTAASIFLIFISAVMRIR